MTFQVVLFQEPDGKAELLRINMGTDELHLRLIKDISNVVHINGHRATLDQKLVLRRLGAHRPVNDVAWEGDVMLASVRMRGHEVVWWIGPDGAIWTDRTTAPVVAPLRALTHVVH